MSQDWLRAQGNALHDEARILASLNHPGIAILQGLEQPPGGAPVLVMATALSRGTHGRHRQRSTH